MNSKQQGTIGLAKAMAYFSTKGYTVLLPISDGQRYDLAIDNKKNILRIEVKTTTYIRNKSYEVNLKTCGGNQSWNKIPKFLSPDDCDFVFIWCSNNTEYLIPIEIVKNKGKLTLTEKYNMYKTIPSVNG